MVRRDILAAAMLGAALVAGAGSAHAQASGVVQRQDPAATAPWYERFTFGSDPALSNRAAPRADLRPAVPITPRSRWGLTLGVPAQSERPLAQPGRASAGAFYQVSPRLRVGGEVTVPQERGFSDKSRDPRAKDEGPGVKVEGAFRF